MESDKIGHPTVIANVRLTSLAVSARKCPVVFGGKERACFNLSASQETYSIYTHTQLGRTCGPPAFPRPEGPSAGLHWWDPLWVEELPGLSTHSLEHTASS